MNKKIVLCTIFISSFFCLSNFYVKAALAKDNNTTKQVVDNFETIGSLDSDLSALSAYENKVIKLVNINRARAGVQKLKKNNALIKVARLKSKDMINKGYFSHFSPTYGSPFKMMETFGLRFSAAGENIAMGQDTPEEVMSAWMRSPGHRSNILSNSFTEISVGLAKNKAGSLYWTQMFIRPIR